MDDLNEDGTAANGRDASAQFTFNISLTVLNHLGRQLYRNFITILGEAISNAWDADASNVWIDIDRGASTMTIVDDGLGMTRDDLQERFLKIGYTKRGPVGTDNRSPHNRPYIGAKGIGKLALLSCAQLVSVESRAKGRPAVGCTIDNSGLDKAINQDLNPIQFPLPGPDPAAVQALGDRPQGTALYFSDLHANNSTNTFLRTALALHYRFSLIDDSFKIHYNGTPITVGELAAIAEKTEFVWRTPSFEDPYLRIGTPLKEDSIDLGPGAKGFIATVRKPSDLAIYGTGEREGIDLFVNGRLRERDLMRHFPTSRVPAQYIYGQIHLDSLDEPGRDPFTSSREGIVEGDPKFDKFLEHLKRETDRIIGEWDDLRFARHEDGDPERKKHTPRQRAASRLIGTTVESLIPHDADDATKRKAQAAQKGMSDSTRDYATIYFIENLMRQMLADDYEEGLLEIPKEIAGRITGYRKTARHQAETADLAILARAHDEDIYYLGLNDLMALCDDVTKRTKGTELIKRLNADQAKLTVLRNIVMHTADLTPQGRTALRAEVDNLEAKIRKAIEDSSTPGEETPRPE